MNSTQHDELAELFAQNMQLSYQAAAAQQQQQQQQEAAHIQHVPQVSEKHDEPITYMSTHYTPTAHLRPDTTSEPSRSPPPPYHEEMPEAMAQILRDHNIDPSSLLPNQVQLFGNADYEQRTRLLELWRIAPPSYPSQQQQEGRWSGNEWVATSLQQEEDEARQRYEQQLASRGLGHEEHMLDTHIVAEYTREQAPMSPIREPGETPWPPAARMRAASIAAGLHKPTHAPSHSMDQVAEPYMSNGYQSQQSTDPVYAAAAGLWQAPSYAQAMEQVRGQQNAVFEEQRKVFDEQIRCHADWERMNERIARERMGQVDEDMEL
ncbi:hypothetical protein LTR62_005508 [Meristemomyces frigidus]|uniref:Uncharacterized protein n=1 Tax=Meristemomyces frigidus TaxID=1508187 RepID=A0AAN7TDE1_9PEZI|nr:hypothetical protein LTR62_005508 [Meristemomyces frigidus]